MIGWNEEIKKELGGCGTDVLIGFNVIFTNPKQVFLGNKVRIDPFTLITTALTTGDHVQICSHAVLGGGSKQLIQLGNWTWIGYGSKLFTASEDYSGDGGPVNEFWNHENIVERGNIVLSDFSGCASDVMIMPGTVLPIGTAIGAKSLVWSDSFKQTSKLPKTLFGAEGISAWSGPLSVVHEGWGLWWGNPLQFKKMRNKDKILERAAQCT